MDIMDNHKLIVPLKADETKIIYYVNNEGLYVIMYEAYIKIGHGGRTRIMDELQNKFKNMTYEVVMLFLSLCVQCQTKQNVSKKGIVIKPIISLELNSRCQVDLVDMQTCKDGEFKFIINYQDHLTKFISELCSMWNGVKIVHGKPRHSQTQGSIERVNQDFQNILKAMMEDNDTTKWSEALPFVQFAKNTTYHQGIKQTPYEAMFGTKAQRGVLTSSPP
ncbi:hypothetical protein QTP88_018058 [Uroleucon formosanum]